MPKFRAGLKLDDDVFSATPFFNYKENEPEVFMQGVTQLT